MKNTINPASHCQLCGASSTDKQRYVTHENPWLHFVGPLCRRCFTILIDNPGWFETSPSNPGKGS